MTDLHRAGLEDGISGAEPQQPEQPYYMAGYKEGQERRRTFLRLRNGGLGFYQAAATASITHEQAEGVH